MAPGVILAILLFCGTFVIPSNQMVILVLNAGSDSTDTAMKQFVRSLSGKWSIQFEISATADLPKGGTGHGEEVWKSGPGDLSFIEEYHSVGDEGEITGRGTFWWDEHLHRIQVLWCANYLPGGCEIMSEGASWDGNRLILKNRWESGGKTHFVKEVFSDISSTSFTQTIFQGESFEKLNITYVFHARKESDSTLSSRLSRHSRILRRKLVQRIAAFQVVQ
jgi:hypothetical protein